MSVDLVLGDCLEGLKSLPDKSIACVVTSPPYNLDIKYGEYEDNKPRDNYLAWLNAIFSEVKRVLVDDGQFFLNVGYSNIDPWVAMDVANEAREHFVLQNNITWVKSIAIDDVTYGHFKPITSGRFITPTNESIFHFTKTGEVTIDRLSIGVPYMWECNTDKLGRAKGRLAKRLGYDNINDFNKNHTPEDKEVFDAAIEEKAEKLKDVKPFRCKGNTWYIPYSTAKAKDRGEHPATFPLEVPTACIKMANISAGTVLDPFSGTGTTLVAAVECGLDAKGYELDKKYYDFALKRTEQALVQYNLFGGLFDGKGMPTDDQG